MKTTTWIRTCRIAALLGVAIVTMTLTRLALSQADGGSRFQQFDKNRDGKVTREEADNAAWFDTLDADHDGKLSATELGPALSHEMADEDTNRDGQLDASEAARAKSKAFDQADANNDGVLSVEEVVEYDASVSYSARGSAAN